MCKYCEETTSKGCISGKNFNVIPTVYLKAKTNYDRLNCFILKCKEDEKAGFMIGTYEGYCYIDINYCPMCGRKIGENMENKDISRIVHNTLRRIDNYNLDIVRMKVKDIKYVLEYCVSLEKERDGIYSDYQDLGKEKLKLEEEVEHIRNRAFEEGNIAAKQLKEQEKVIEQMQAEQEKMIELMANKIYKISDTLNMLDMGKEINYDLEKLFNGIDDKEALQIIIDYFKKKAKGE